MADNPLVVVATGSSATIMLPSYLSALRQETADPLVVLLTHSAERFVRPEVVGWFADEVVPAAADGLNPVQLALTARAMVVLPATVHTLGAVALGLPSTPATTALLAAPGPCLWFPHTNPVLWDKPVVRRHVETLRADGHTVVDPTPADVYEIWRRATAPGLAMPGPLEAARTVREWLASR